MIQEGCCHWELKMCDTNFLSLETESPPHKCCLHAHHNQNEYGYEDNGFFVLSRPRLCICAMLSWNMMAFGWELVIIESEVNSSGGILSRGNSRSLFFWNFTLVIMTLTWSQLMRLKTHDPASKLPTRRLWYISSCSCLCLKCICWCADHWTDQWKSATILVSIEFVSTFWSPWLSSGSMLCDPFQPCHLNKYFFATWNV